jgi:hypothetical protein
VTVIEFVFVNSINVSGLLRQEGTRIPFSSFLKERNRESKPPRHCHEHPKDNGERYILKQRSHPIGLRYLLGIDDRRHVYYRITVGLSETRTPESRPGLQGRL